MKRMREPFEKSKKAKKARLGESSGSRPPIPLAGSPSKSIPLSRSVKIKPLASSLPQTTPIYTTSDTPPSTTITSNPPSLKFNLATITLPVSEEEMLNETTSPSLSPSPQSPPYYELSSDTEPSDHQSPTLAQLQARALASQQPSHSEPKPKVTSPPPEHPNPTTSELTPPPAQQPIHSEPQPTQPSSEPHPEPEQTTQSPSDIAPPITSAASITPTLNLSAPNSPSPPSATELETTLLTLEEAIQFNSVGMISEMNNYVARPPTFSGDSIKFEWWKSKMYTHIIDLDDELWDILEDGINIQVNSVGMVSERKSLTPAKKKIYKKTP
ncbi:extensin-like [Lathyrus oleraceus]|uniref:extensin-like n=1 Tax=Pisum sativum TaxID=3888 RepID=UPI0021CE58D3|nr:extensin-like [Pisum sativum]